MTSGPPALTPREPAQPRAPGQGGGSAPASVRLPLHRVRLTYVLLGVISVVFVGQLASEQVMGFDWPAAVGAKVNALIAAGEYWRLITPVFLHASLLHFFFNMYALYNLGREVESYSGARRLALIFFVAGLAGTVFSLLFTPNPSVGASGGIFGLIGAQGVFLYRHRRLFGEGGRRGLQQVVFIALINLAIGLQGRIDNWAHVGGLLGGLALSWILGPAWDIQPDPLNPGQPTVVDQQAQWPYRWAALGALAIALGVLTVAGIARAGGLGV